ncbi:MAG: N-acetyl-gamma-glutamyl-phosphate reductase [Proteobacteria bacterium]|nr:N-acetyl-gamma-glutamyl-phosphate reductase [Pseudomonadota bacterium]
MTKVGIIGATGYTGVELVRLIAGHPEATLSIITSRQHAGVSISDVYPALNGIADLTCDVFSVEKVCEMTDVVFLALPHKMPMEIVPDLIKNNRKVIDLSADFRFRDIARYESAYQAHTSAHLASESVYGLAEVYRNEIRAASLIGNPGCYPTSILLPMIPLIKERLINPGTIISDSKSGVSGAGRGLSLGSHFCEVNESFKAYKVVEHRHTPEIEEILSIEAGTDVNITFIPHLIPVTRGMLSTIYTDLVKTVSEKTVFDCLNDYYRDAPFVRILKNKKVPDILWVSRTNYCDIGFRIDKRTNRLIVISAIDNLMKGASGQAVQNMNIMLGIDETTGLNDKPFLL